MLIDVLRLFGFPIDKCETCGKRYNALDSMGNQFQCNHCFADMMIEFGKSIIAESDNPFEGAARLMEGISFH